MMTFHVRSGGSTVHFAHPCTGIFHLVLRDLAVTVRIEMLKAIYHARAHCVHMQGFELVKCQRSIGIRIELPHFFGHLRGHFMRLSTGHHCRHHVPIHHSHHVALATHHSGMHHVPAHHAHLIVAIAHRHAGHIPAVRLAVGSPVGFRKCCLRHANRDHHAKRNNFLFFISHSFQTYPRYIGVIAL